MVVNFDIMCKVSEVTSLFITLVGIVVRNKTKVSLKVVLTLDHVEELASFFSTM